jgi:ABC-type transport system substrate-binding protein
MPDAPSRRTVLLGTAAGALAVPFIRRAHAAAPFFKLYFMIPNNQAARMAWGTLAARQMTQIGIDVVPSYVPFSAIYPRRNKGDGKTYPEGGWDVYLERYYYSSIKPTPNELFSSRAIPPAGQNFYYVEDPVLDRAMDQYAGSVDPAVQMTAIHAFEQRWYDTEPLTILFYPEDVIATNPKLSGLDSTTFRPAFYPRPEKWTIDGAGKDASAAFACWPAPDSCLPMYGEGYNDTNVCGPVYNQLLEYDDWAHKQLQPALAEKVDESPDGKTWVVTLRGGVTWHDGEPFTAEDVKFTLDTILNPAYASDTRASLTEALGDSSAYKVTGPLEITFTLPKYSMLMRDYVLSAIPIMPKHAYETIKPEQMRGHPINTFRGTWTVKTSKGSYTAKGGIGTGPWITGGYDLQRKAYSYTRNPNYWGKMPGNVTTYYHVNIQGTDAVLAALKAGEIDAHDPLYDVGPLGATIDPSWAKLLRFDSYKWQHICYNLRHPVIGTGVDTPLGRKDPSRAAEAAAYIRKAISFATPRDDIIKQMAGGYGHPGTVPIPWSSAEYDHEMLKPIPFDMDLARQYMAKAGYGT